jgi:hypothetical protein
MKATHLKKAGMMTMAAALAVSGAAFAAQLPGNTPCTVGPSGPMPPGCVYRTPTDIHNAGLQNQIDLEGSHAGFANQHHYPGGVLQGTIERFDSTLVLTLTGINDLKGVKATVRLPALTETHLGPRDPKADFQRFDTQMYSLEGTTSDANFEHVKIVAGLANGLDSPGSTTMTRQRDGGFLVNSQFRMNYRIELRGAKGGPFEGVNVSEEGVTTVQAFGE